VVAVNALAFARTRHGCRGVLAPLPVSSRCLSFECADCHGRVEVTLLEASSVMT
jgi:hypothetical protein